MTYRLDSSSDLQLLADRISRPDRHLSDVTHPPAIVA